ncbi:MAG: adenylate/guanylate cyclase domain-containing protein [Bacteroidota bacterium]
MNRLLSWGLLFSLLFSIDLQLHSQVLLEAGKEVVYLNKQINILIDKENKLALEEVKNHPSFQALSEISLPLSPNYTYWIKVELLNPGNQHSNWMLFNPSVGMAKLYVIDSLGKVDSFHSGRNMPGRMKDVNEGDFIHFPLHIKAQRSQTLYLKLWEIDHQALPINLKLYDLLTWKDEDHIPLENTILIFLGIFGIMCLYNLVLFITVRFKAYLFYALYLLCVGTFVLFAVGPMTHPSFGDPRYLVPIGHLAFSAINIFYYLFGKSFLDLKDLLPTWDRILSILITIKTTALIISQSILYTSFNLPLALGIEFSLLFLDVILNLVFFIALFRTKDRLALYFIGGSGSVIVLGLSLAVLGHLFSIPNSFSIFLSTIVVEIIFFSLGLGYRIRKTEKEKVDAEREKRLAQEALNEKLSSLNIAFKRFVPHEFIKSLGHNDVLDVNLGDGVEKEVTVLFSDIRDYTSLSERMTPKENFDFLNTYLGKMGPAIQKHRGFVNQYYGDGIMALFPRRSEDALLAAREMLATLEHFNEEREEVLRIGIGLHTGQLMMGVIGDADRMDASVVADTVNTASRMEGLTKHYGTSIVLSGQALKDIVQPKDYLIRFLGKVQVKGRKEAVHVHESKPLLSRSEKEAFLELSQTFQEGLDAYYAQNFTFAIAAFEEILSSHPEDKASQLYLSRALSLAQEGVPQNWSGIEMMQK